MIKITQLILLTCLLISCQNPIKDTNAKVDVEKGTEVVTENKPIEKTSEQPTPPAETSTAPTDALLGFWVGYFEKDEQQQNVGKTLVVDEGFVWSRENKINISIDEITEGIVNGHSVVAGNNRPFTGTVEKQENGSYSFQVKEPGDNKYDGVFSFTIDQDRLKGKWIAYKNIEIKHRQYDLEKKAFTYDPDVMLEQSKSYVNWNEFLSAQETTDYDGEFQTWIRKEFATTTPLIYKINASNKLLKKSTVENLKKGDLTVIRNSIYARHGYSFRNRPLRVFFDAQPWYIPVNADIKADFTDIEKQNIKLLLKYEKNAAEYYDRFGRG